MMMTDVRDQSSKVFAVVDLDTGQVLGTNLVLVRVASVEAANHGSATDSEILEFAERHSISLYSDTP